MWRWNLTLPFFDKGYPKCNLGNSKKLPVTKESDLKCNNSSWFTNEFVVGATETFPYFALSTEKNKMKPRQSRERNRYWGAPINGIPHLFFFRRNSQMYISSSYVLPDQEISSRAPRTTDATPTFANRLFTIMVGYRYYRHRKVHGFLKYRGHVSQVHTLDGGYKVYGSSVLSRLKIEDGVAVFIFLFIDKSQDTFDKIATTSTGSEIECGRPCDSDYTNIQGTNQHRFQETIPQSMHYVIKNTCLNLIVASHLKHHQ